MGEPSPVQLFWVKRQAARSKLSFGQFVAATDPRQGAFVGLAVIVGPAIAAAAWGLPLPEAIAFVAAVAVAVVLGLWGLARFLSREPTGPQTVVVGSDGLRLEYGDGARFIPVQRLIGVSQQGATIAIKSRGAANVELEMPDAYEAEALCEAADAVLTRSETAGSAEARALVERFSGSLAERADGVAAAVGGRGVYRERGLSPDDLAALAADPRLRPQHRITAAAALQRVDEERSRIVIDEASKASANQPLGSALEALNQGELDEELVVDADQWHRGRHRR